jgi:glycosyltransferase involved in cell wall biosynthesis
VKIVFVMPPGGIAATGGFRIIAGYSDWLQARGHEVVMLAPHGAPPRSRKLRRRALQWLKRLTSPRGADAPPFVNNPDVTITIVKGKDRLDPEDFPEADIYVASWWETVEWVAALPAGAAKLHFVQDHEIFPYLPVERAHAAYRQPFAKIVVSQWLLDRMRECYSVEDAILVENAVECALFEQPARRKPERRTVGFLYSHAERKNSAMAIEACRLLKRRFPELCVLSFGNQAPKASDNMPGWVEYSVKPSAEEISRIYGACDVWLFSSDEEGFGLPILEAMAAGAPVVATPAGAAPQLVDGVNGTIVAHDAGALADAAARIIVLQPDAWKKMSLAAEETARRRDWDAAAKEFEAALLAAVGGRGTL